MVGILPQKFQKLPVRLTMAVVERPRVIRLKPEEP